MYLQVTRGTHVTGLLVGAKTKSHPYSTMERFCRHKPTEDGDPRMTRARARCAGEHAVAVESYWRGTTAGVGGCSVYSTGGRG